VSAAAVSADFEVLHRSMVADFAVYSLGVRASERTVFFSPERERFRAQRAERLLGRSYLLRDLRWARAQAALPPEHGQRLEADGWCRDDLRELGDLLGAW